MWEILLTVGLQLVGHFLSKSKVDEKIKKNYFEWIALAGKDIGSVKLMEYGKKQMEWFDSSPFVETT